MGKGSVRNVMSDKRPYKVYTALLTQSGTNAPIPIILENTLGDISWSRLYQGGYLAVSSNLFTNEKTFVVFSSLGPSYDSDVNYLINSDSFDSSMIGIGTQTAGVAQDDLLLLAPIEIRVYN